MDDLVLKDTIENFLVKKAQDKGVEFTREDLDATVQEIIDSGITLGKELDND